MSDSRVKSSLAQSLQAADEQFLQNLYGDEIDAEAFPLVEPPPSLQKSLYQIPRGKPQAAAKHTRAIRFGALAACALLVLTGALLGVDHYQQTQQALKAQQQLNAALYYLQKANTKAGIHVHNELKDHLQESTITPVIDTFIDVSSG